MVFVVGTGRSGTHWLGWTLDEHPDVRATIERSSIFRRVGAAALDPRVETRHLHYLHARYTWEHLRSWPRCYVDKSHPNLWHVETLSRYFPEAKFLAMRREVHPTVASMLRHRGVMAWQARWREFPVPNRFLGITGPLADVYDDLGPAAQCALRWKAHRDRVDRLVSDFDAERFLVVDYEDMAADYEKQARRIWDFVGLAPQSISIDVKAESLTRWKSQLTPSDMAGIASVVSG